MVPKMKNNTNSEGSQESSDSDSGSAITQSELIFDKLSPDQMRLYLKIQATQRGIQIDVEKAFHQIDRLHRILKQGTTLGTS
ncbi:unnamed protein product [Caenorhabditis angaria]|uniref:Uncharacterized protein n=1 Tax=Caenorhabditis angaria TaxID=860376 RepID=A0A9P1J835_9PELO|nr:unnamed protein product [Caenorhabditis angaria]